MIAVKFFIPKSKEDINVDFWHDFIRKNLWKFSDIKIVTIKDEIYNISNNEKQLKKWTFVFESKNFKEVQNIVKEFFEFFKSETDNKIPLYAYIKYIDSLEKVSNFLEEISQKTSILKDDSIPFLPRYRMIDLT